MGLNLGLNNFNLTENIDTSGITVI